MDGEIRLPLRPISGAFCDIAAKPIRSETRTNRPRSRGNEGHTRIDAGSSLASRQKMWRRPNGRLPQLFSAPDLHIRLRSATSEDAAFVVEMARHACVIEDWPLPDVDSEEVQSVLPASGNVPIVAVDAAGRRVGAVWTFHNDPPLPVDAAGDSLPELCIGVAPGMRGRGVGGALLDALFARSTGGHRSTLHQRARSKSSA
jgi:ribosomal protein S18 acetylase RimI-like enzyme